MPSNADRARKYHFWRDPQQADVMVGLDNASRRREKRLTGITALLAAGMFIPLFVLRHTVQVDFWWWMAGNMVVLLTWSALFDPDWRLALFTDVKHEPLVKITWGVVSAIGLYILFRFAGHVARSLFVFAESGIKEVYAFKHEASTVRIVLFMVFLIGPGEELFWRGFLQRRWQLEYGSTRGMLMATALYGLVHVGSANIMLVAAAVVCGGIWGLLFMKTGSVLLNVVSHTLWDVLIFILLPVAE